MRTEQKAVLLAGGDRRSTELARLLAARPEFLVFALGLGEGLQAFALVAVGYPAEKAAPHDRFDPSRVQWR